MPSDAENQACLRDLARTDPRLDKKRIERRKAVCSKTPIAGCSTIPISKNGAMDKTDYSGSRVIPARARPCCCVASSTSWPGHLRIRLLLLLPGPDARINTAAAVLRGLIYQLADQQPSLISHIRRNYDVLGKELFEGRMRGMPCRRSLPACLQIPSRRVPT